MYMHSIKEIRCFLSYNFNLSQYIISLNLLGKGKAIAKTKGAQPPSPVKERSTRNAKQLYKDLISKQLEEESSSSDDDEDKTFEGPEGKCSYPHINNLQISLSF